MGLGKCGFVKFYGQIEHIVRKVRRERLGIGAINDFAGHFYEMMYARGVELSRHKWKQRVEEIVKTLSRVEQLSKLEFTKGMILTRR